MSDSSWVTDEESHSDFSASEDEWKPTKQDKESSDSDFAIEKHSDGEEVGPTHGKRKLPKGRSSSSSSSTRGGRGGGTSGGGPPAKKRFSQSLRDKLYNKYKPLPKTMSPIKLNSSLSTILESSKYSKKKSSAPSSKHDEDDDDDDSSGDDNLVDPKNIDLSSSFYQKIDKDSGRKGDMPPNFECNVGCLSDSGSDDSDDNQDEQPREIENFSNLHNFNNTMARAREALKKYQANNVERAKEASASDDIGALLAAGEKNKLEPSGSAKVTKKQSSKKEKSSKSDPKPDTDSEWEDVNELAEVKPKTEVSKGTGGLQIVVQLPGQVRKSKKQNELELELKRKLNRIRRENQLDLHKANILCWIAHMNYANQVLNNPTLMAEAVKMIPSSQCYPKDKTNIDYFEQISRWYKTAIAIKNNVDEYPAMKKRPPLDISLGLQIKNKTAICKRDFVFIFVILARAIGLQCRIVYNFVVAPIRPALADMVPINRVKTEEKIKIVKKAITNKESEASSSKSVAIEPTKKSKLAVIKEEPQIKKNTPKAPAKNVSACQTAAKKSQPIQKQEVEKKPKAAPKKSEVTVRKPVAKKTAATIAKEQLKAPAKKAVANKSESKVGKEPSKSAAKQSAEPVIKNDMSKVMAKKLETILKKDQAKAQTQKPKVPEGNEKTVIKSTKIVKSKEPQKTDSPTHFKKSANLAKLKLTKPSGVVEAVGKTPSKKRLRSDKNNPLKIDQLDGANDVFDEPKKRQRTTRAAKPEVIDQPVPSTSKASTRKSVSFQVQQKPADLTKLKATTTKSTVTKRAAAKDVVDDSDEDFKPSPVKKAAVKPVATKSNSSKPKETVAKSRIDRRCLSSDDEKKTGSGCDYWVELYSEKSKRWYCVDLLKTKVDCPEDLRKQASHPVSYVLAWQNDNTIKDVSPRYCTLWNTTTRMLRVPQQWLDTALKNFVGKKTTDRDKREDRELNKMHADEPIPKVISEFKNHPLYALRRHLLKFEEIYPPDALTLGFIRNEPIYARECVHTLHSREIWVKQARVVKPGEKPYKIVTARPKWDRLSQTVIKDVPLEIFGIWQTKEYEPPTAQNGVVPRNPYGNVELFKECMLPKKTVHLKLNGLNRVCKKLGVDCASAVIGFDFHQGSSHPVYDGFVVCEEFAEKVVEAWFVDQEEQEKRETEKYEKRVYGNWKRLIRGLLIREKLKIKYKYESLKSGD